MTYVTSWDDFAKAAERIYLADHLYRARFVLKYRHSDGCIVVKMTDNVECVQYKTESAQDLKKLEKLNNMLMRHMATRDTHH